MRQWRVDLMNRNACAAVPIQVSRLTPNAIYSVSGNALAAGSACRFSRTISRATIRSGRWRYFSCRISAPVLQTELGNEVSVAFNSDRGNITKH
jgi:hypothetical protein